MIQLTPAAEADWLEKSALEYARLKFQALDIDELNTLDIATVAGFLNKPVAWVAKNFAVLELGHRSRRIRISEYKAYLARIEKKPAKG